MKSIRNRPHAAGVMACVALASACASTPDDARSCRPVPVEEALELRQPSVSFRAVVAPLLASSCAFSGCHKRNSGIALDLEIESAELHALLLTGIPVAAPTMRYVVPGQWPKSFLLNKLDGTQCSLGEACEVDACGERMPLGSEPLAASERDDLRRWIAQGAALD